MKTLTIKTKNGDVNYDVRELDFANVACDLEDYGISIIGDDIEGKTISICRAMLGIVTGEKDKHKAGIMLNEHIKNGGSVAEILDLFREAMEDAGFGEATEETATPEAQSIVTAQVTELPKN